MNPKRGKGVDIRYFFNFSDLRVTWAVASPEKKKPPTISRRFFTEIESLGFAGRFRILDESWILDSLL